LDLTLPQEKVREVTDIAVAHVNAAALELRRLFLVEDFFDSFKFGILLWCLTYVGSWFNGMTLIIIGTYARVASTLIVKCACKPLASIGASMKDGNIRGRYQLTARDR
jgi:hypothetical protein